MIDWQPIETAPKDGTWFLAHGLAYKELNPLGSWFTHETGEPMIPRTLIVWWREDWHEGYTDLGNGTYRKEPHLFHAGWEPADHAFRPTHWMPLPEPPK